MNMKSVVRFIGTIGLLAAFIGCSSDTSPTPAQPQQSTSFNSYEELVANSGCNESVNGSVAYTALENANFICTFDAATGIWSWTLVQENIPQTEQPAQSGDGENLGNQSGEAINLCPLNSPIEAFVNSSVASGTMTDSRDGMVYRTVKIGNQEWMAENLKYRCQENKLNADPINPESYEAVIGVNVGFCNDLYGFFYDDRAVNWCPEGWHVPDVAEWDTLLSFAGGQNAGAALKSTICWAEGSKTYDAFGNVVNQVNNGDLETDAFGFTVLPSGRARESFHTGTGYTYRVHFVNHSVGETALFWGTGETYRSQAICSDDGACRTGVMGSTGIYIVKFNLTGPVTIEPYTNSDYNSYAYFSDSEMPLANVRCIKD